ALEPYREPSGRAAHPDLLVLTPQLIRLLLQLVPLRICLVHACESTLQADELTARVATLLKPVGEDETQRVVIGVVTDSSEEGCLIILGCGHHTTPEKLGWSFVCARMNIAPSRRIPGGTIGESAFREGSKSGPTRRGLIGGVARDPVQGVSALCQQL